MHVFNVFSRVRGGGENCEGLPIAFDSVPKISIQDRIMPPEPNYTVLVPVLPMMEKWKDSF